MKVSELFVALSFLLVYSCNSPAEGEQHSLDSTKLQHHADTVRSSEISGAGKGVRISHAQKTFDTYIVDYPSENLQFYWKDDAGNKLISIDRQKNTWRKKENN